MSIPDIPSKVNDKSTGIKPILPEGFEYFFINWSVVVTI